MQGGPGRSRGRAPALAVADLRASALTSVLFNLVPRFGEGFCPRAHGAWQERLHPVNSPGRQSLKVGARSGVSAQTGRPSLEEGPGRPFAGTHAAAAETPQACRGPHGRAPSSGGRARAGSRTMTRAPLAAAPSQPAGKPISHSGRQSPAAQRFVPRGPGPLSLALITLSRLTAPPAAPRTPVPRRPPHNGSGNRPRWGPG